MAAIPDSENTDTQAYLPDFCAAGTVFVVVLVGELVAILLTIAAHDTPGMFQIELAKNSLFIQWLAILSAVVMCGFRARLESTGKTRAFILSFVVLEILCLLLAEVAYQVGRQFGGPLIIAKSHPEFMIQTVTMSSIVIALSMRYLYVSSEWRRSIVLEAQARISALQALIRPHFLFNSMNTIASLTRSDPRLAEAAVEDLSDLLRANLGGSGDRTTLKEEFEVAAIYQRIEKLRLGDRLNVHWDVDELPMRAMILSLTIQPLLENAIYHGVELLPEGGDVDVTGKKDGKHLIITMSNPFAPDRQRSTEGNKMALDNIRQRFKLAYDDQAAVSVKESDSKFTISLRFPHEESSA